jgi:hypothetical protein
MSSLPTASFDIARQTSDLLKILSDEKNFAIFKTIAINTDRKWKVEKEKEEGIDSRNIVVGQTKHHDKAYNERLSQLIKTDLVTEGKKEIQSNNTNITNKDRRYMLTEQGQEVYDACTTVEDAIGIKPKLKALESLFERSSLQNTTIAEDETKKKLIDTVIDNHKIKDSLQNQVSNALTNQFSTRLQQ